MDVQRDLNYQCGWNRYLMKYMGIWPKERKWNRISSYAVLLPSLTMLCFMCAPQTANLPFIAHDLNLVVENLSTSNMVTTIALVKTIIFWANSESMMSLLKCMAKDWATVETRTGRETMMNATRTSRKTTIGCLMLCQFVATSYVFLRLSTLKHSDNKLVYRGYFPYNVSISPSYELTMVGQTMAGIYAALTYTSVDTFIVMLVLHACGQLSNMKDDLRNIHSCDKKNLRARLKKIVEKHNYINVFAETVENCFNVMLLIQMLGFIIQVCFQSFYTITSLGNISERFMIFQIIFLIIYTACLMVQLYLYCYVGEKLTLESTDVANTAYNCEWYSLPSKDARLLIIIMCRARALPLKLTAGKFCWFTVLLYSQVLKTTMSYISVLYATKN
ncbi:odorant receptor 13a-like [Frieseomelitta varia]|uniref:odorant receptor 13a-like n=1 Tax=Frieseomelitta varia TaxID=561572 RepID=UPI001CB6B5E4|nr:odorant receptor 13a-like [Frieseomelitta varia]